MLHAQGSELWERLEEKAHSETVRLRLHFQGSLLDWEITEICRDAMVELWSRRRQFATWEELAVYFHRVCCSRALNSIRKRKRERKNADSTRPPGDRPLDDLSHEDELEFVLSRVSGKTATIILAMLDLIRSGIKPTLPRIAASLGCSVPTVERRLRALRSLNSGRTARTD